MVLFLSPKSNMKISVVVPVRNEEDSIRELLDNLLAQTLLPAQIVIADGGSTDSTTRIIGDYINRGAPIRLIQAGPALPGRGRNLAAAEASHEWIAFIDAGVRPETNWLELLSARAQNEDTIDVVYGSWAPVTDSFFKECAAIAYVPPPAPVRPRSIVSSLMRRTVWSAVGGFPENLRSAEDLIFMNEIDRAGFHAVFEPLALVYWTLGSTFARTFSRFVVYSRNNIRAGLWRQWQAAILTRYLFLLLLMLPVPIVGWWWLTVPFLLWLGMMVARACVAIRRNRLCYPAPPARNLKRLFVLTPLLAVIDCAAIIGTFEWLLKDSFRWTPKAMTGARDGT